MKIYNKKAFASGVFMAALGMLNLIAGVMSHKMDLGWGVLTAALFLLGFGTVMRSISKKCPERTGWRNWMSETV